MKRIVIIVEGQTEAAFFKKIVFPFFAEHGIFETFAYPAMTGAKHKGGSRYAYVKNEIRRVLNRYDHRVVISTFFDYYGLSGFPQSEDCKKRPGLHERVEALELAVASDLNDARIIPYVQLHEFEALLFSSVSGFELFYPAIVPQLSQIIARYPDPESINDNPQTAPSKRILHLCERYDKVTDGVEIAEIVGLSTIMQRCPRFNAWISRLIIEAKKPC